MSNNGRGICTNYVAKTKGPREAAGGRDQQDPRLCTESCWDSGETSRFPGRSAGPGHQRSRGRSPGRGGGPEAWPPVGWGRRGRKAPAVPYIRVTLGSSAGRRRKGRGSLLPPGKRRSVSPWGRGGGKGLAAATGLDFLWMHGGGSPADLIPVHGWGLCSPFGSLRLPHVAPS